MSGVRPNIFLGKMYENLYTIDIICHGVPSLQLLKDNVIKKNDIKGNTRIKFRDTNGFNLSVKIGNKVIYQRNIYKDLYYMGFMKGLFYRPSCYHCLYAQNNRVSDITIGDFWGLGKNNPFETEIKYGVSLLLPLTAKGDDLIDACKDKMFIEKREVCEAIEGNRQLRYPSAYHSNYFLFKKLYPVVGFKRAATISLWKNILKYRILYLLHKLKIR